MMVRIAKAPLRRGLLAVALVASLTVPLDVAPSGAAALPPNFQEQIVFAGLNRPTNIEFARDGRVFVAEKAGRIKVFDSLSDTTPELFADLTGPVLDNHDRGLLGMALAPNFPADPWVYVLYTSADPPDGVLPGGAVASTRLSKLQASGNRMVGTEQLLVKGWCQQFTSHAAGDLKFGADGMLYVTGGDGASYSTADYGQLGSPVNPCADPPGGTMTPPSAEGGALRAQDLRTTGDPVGLNGTLLRLDPVTGEAAAGNANIRSPDPNARRIVAYGLRNPYRFTTRPGTNETWIGDVGWNDFEDIHRMADPTAAPLNFGWPCYEGNGKLAPYDAPDLALCESLYSGARQAAPYFSYGHSASLAGCAVTGGTSVTGTAFYPTDGGSYPAEFRGAFFFADYGRGCIWAMKPASAGGLPSPAGVSLFADGAASPVDLEIGPTDRDLYYADLLGGTVRRIRYFVGNQPPVAVLRAAPNSGPAPLTVAFDATGSSDAEGDPLSYEWDFTNDGTVDAATATASFTYRSTGTFTAKLTVRDSFGLTDSKTVTINAGNDAPTAVIDTPATSLRWASGLPVTFSGHATDRQQAGNLPDSALSWELRIRHCSEPTACHTHDLQSWSGVSSGSFVAPEHEYPSYLELSMTARDSAGLTNTVVRRLDPATVDITFASNPIGLQLTVGATTQTTPFTRTFIKGSATTISAPATQTAGATTYWFGGWSDNGARTHVMSPWASTTTYLATYRCDGFGYRCGSGPANFVPANDTVLELTGRRAVKQITLPFPVKLYGQSYETAWVDTGGVLSFAPLAAAASDPSPIPSQPAANRSDLALFPFWDDLTVDAAASVRTAVLGAGSKNRSLVIEWRNVALTANPSKRVTFEVIIDEVGRIAFIYRDLADGDPQEQGGGATVGIENAGGTGAVQWSYRQPVLRSGISVWFVPPGLEPVPRKPGVPGS